MPVHGCRSPCASVAGRYPIACHRRWPKPSARTKSSTSELPPSLPLMALRSTIVYPLGTIAVQMGAPGEPRAAARTRRARADRRARRRRRRSRRADRPAASSSAASASPRACTSASTCPATRSRSRCRGCAASRSRRSSRSSRTPIARDASRREETPADPAELDDLVARVVVGRRDAGRARRPHPGRGAGDPEDERLRSGAVRRPRGDEHELPHLRQGRGAAAARRRPAAAVHPRRGSSAKSRARA